MRTDFNRITTPPVSTPRRLFKNIWRQSHHTAFCPEEPCLDGKVALVTGGNGGIGFETAKGLAQRGAEVVIMSRNPSTAELAVQDIKNTTGSKVHFVSLDLADLETITPAADKLHNLFPNRPIDLVIANAGIVARHYAQSPQGYELCYAVNVLGHHAIIRSLYNSSKLISGSRIIMLTGDIYFRANECTPEFTYDSKSAGMAYCRSKLGNLWWVQEWTKRYKEMEAYAVHPGVVNSNLGGRTSGFRAWLRSKIMITPEEGAQTSLFCATQIDLIPGGYYHNTMGRIQLNPGDPGSDTGKSAEFWDKLEEITGKIIEK